jgi:hypothetical protein
MSAGNVKVDVRLVTPEMAAGWQSECALTYQRKLRDPVAEYYSQEMLRGDWDLTTVLSFGRVLDGPWKLVDGQHRLSAVIRSSTTQPFVLKYVTYKTEEDLANAYARTDQGAKRTPNDQARAWALAERYGLFPEWVGRFTAGVRFVSDKFGWRNFRPHPTELHALMDEYAEAMRGFYNVGGNTSKLMRNPMRRSATVAVGLVTFRFSANIYGIETVEKFWEGISLDDGLHRGDPRKTAHDHLLGTRMGFGSGKGPSISPAYSSRWLASCFNAHVENRNLYDAKPDPTKPIKINGSPFNGK